MAKNRIGKNDGKSNMDKLGVRIFSLGNFWNRDTVVSECTSMDEKIETQNQQLQASDSEAKDLKAKIKACKIGAKV